jgi:hypothetical protein
MGDPCNNVWFSVSSSFVLLAQRSSRRFRSTARLLIWFEPTRKLAAIPAGGSGHDQRRAWPLRARLDGRDRRAGEWAEHKADSPREALDACARLRGSEPYDHSARLFAVRLESQSSMRPTRLAALLLLGAFAATGLTGCASSSAPQASRSTPPVPEGRSLPSSVAFWDGERGLLGAGRCWDCPGGTISTTGGRTWTVRKTTSGR